MAGFRVDPEALLAAADRMSEFDQRVEANLARVTATVEQLDASWYGDAGQSERVAQDRWNKGAEEMREALAQLRDIAERAHANYSGAIQLTARMWD
jgi:WXG100 family type VII secretion target